LLFKLLNFPPFFPIPLFKPFGIEFIIGLINFGDGDEDDGEDEFFYL
jgi:hypothetical protein